MSSDHKKTNVVIQCNSVYRLFDILLAIDKRLKSEKENLSVQERRDD